MNSKSIRYGCLSVAMALMLHVGLQARIKVVFDPGHGGDATGMITPISGYYEKHINLQVADTLNAELMWAGMVENTDYVFTHLVDSTVGNPERAYLANGLNAERFVSIHHNSYDPCPAGSQQHTVVLYSTLAQCDGGPDDPPSENPWLGWDRNTSDTLAMKLGYRIRDDAFGYPFSKPRDAGNTKTVLSRTFMESAITEASFVCDLAEARHFYDHPSDPHTLDEACTILEGWYSAHTGQGIGMVDYIYDGDMSMEAEDLPVWICLEIGGPDIQTTVPYEGCWNLNDYVRLVAPQTFDTSGYTYYFHHWQWLDYIADTVRNYPNYQEAISFYVQPDYQYHTHYYRALYSGGYFQSYFTAPSIVTTEIKNNEPYSIEWNASQGILSSCSLYVDFTSNGGSTWSTVVGPIPYD